MKAILELEGFKELDLKFKNYNNKVNNVLENSLEICGNDLQQKSQDLTPVDTGALKASTYTKTEMGKPSVVVGFEEEYAVFVHEDLTANHSNGGQAKFLEQPFKENQDKYVNYIKEQLKDFLK